MATQPLLEFNSTPKKSKWMKIIVSKCKSGILLAWNHSDLSSRPSIGAQLPSFLSTTLPSIDQYYDSSTSFDELEHWYTEAIQNCSEDAVFALIGAQKDR